MAVAAMEIRKNFLGRAAILVYLLALMPVALFAARAVAVLAFRGSLDGFSDEAGVFATIYQTFILRFVVFFGCMGIFANLSRGDILDKSLHYYFLVPARREVIAVGKYLAGLAAALVLFGVSTAGSLLFLYVPHGWRASTRHLLEGPGLSHAASYMLVTGIACLAYGALFLAVGFLFRNPILPAIGILVWEGFSFLLPPLLKKISIVYYLQALCPVQVFTGGPFALVAELPSQWVAAPALIVLTVVLLAVAGRAIRRMEVHYGTD